MFTPASFGIIGAILKIALVIDLYFHVPFTSETKLDVKPLETIQEQVQQFESHLILFIASLYIMLSHALARYHQSAPMLEICCGIYQETRTHLFMCDLS